MIVGSKITLVSAQVCPTKRCNHNDFSRVIRREKITDQSKGTCFYDIPLLSRCFKYKGLRFFAIRKCWKHVFEPSDQFYLLFFLLSQNAFAILLGILSDARIQSKAGWKEDTGILLRSERKQTRTS